MKRRFTILTAAFALLTILAFPMGMWGQSTYTKVATAPSDWSGTYVIVADESSVIFTGQSGTNNYGGYAAVTISNNSVTGDFSGYEVEIEKSGDHYSIKHISSSKYLGLTSDGNNLNFNTETPTDNKFRWILSTSEIVPANYSNTRRLQYNNASSGLRFACYKKTQKDAFLYKKETGGTTTCATPTFSPAAGTYTQAQNVSISCATEGATIYYTTDGNDPTTNSTVYADPISVSSEMTIKAMATADGFDNSAVATAEYAFITLDHAGTLEDPYSVADAHTAIDANAGIQNVYATGIVSAIPTAWSTDYNNITFNFVDNSGDTDFLQAFRCVSGTGVDASTVAVGDIVVVYGNLTKYGSTYEFGQGCQLVSLTPTTEPSIAVTPTEVNISAEGATGALTVTCENIDDSYEIGVRFYSDPQTPATDPAIYEDWFEIVPAGGSSNDFHYEAYSNEGDARTAYLTICAFAANGEMLTESQLVTFNQAAYVAPTFAELPFSFNGGMAAIEETDGLSQEGLGTDYSSAPYLKFDGTGDWLLLQFNERPGTLAFDIKGNSFSGGTFKVQTSADGVSYSDLETYTSFGNNETFEEVFDNLDENVRYIKWIYTEKVSGNVGLGNIALAKYVLVPSITVTPTEVNISAEGATGALTVTCENIDDSYEIGVRFYSNPQTPATDPAIYEDWFEIVPAGGSSNDFHYEAYSNEGDARTAYLTICAFAANGEMLTESQLVTVNQSAPVVPATGDEYALYTGELVEGDYLIVYDGGAMNTTVESDRLQYEAVTATNNVIVTDNAEIVWHIAQSGQYWTIYNADAEAYAASTGAKNKAQMLTDGTDDKALWTVSGTETYEFVNKQNAANNVNANLRKNGTYGFACYATSTGGALSLYKKVVEPETHTLYIPGYSNATNPKGGYHLIASPVTVNPEDVEGDPQGMIDGNFDLYYFDQAEENEWRNYEAQSFNLVPGKGYLYAHDTDVELTFTGAPYSGNGEFPLSYTEDAVFAGWNLIGNPYNHNVTVDKDFYIMNEDGDEIIPAEEQVVACMQGIFVVATAAGQTVTFSEHVAPIVPLDKIVLNLSQNRGTIIDRAIVRFDEGGQLPKFQLFENSTKLYIPQGNSDYAVVRSEAQGEMPVNFKARENGTYTISVNTENVEMDYLHLIDNMTGTNVDLLQTPSYTFEASTRDYASRFRLVFSAEENGASAGSATFAYFNCNEWVVSNEGEAQLHVIDMTGRIVSTETINGNATVKVNAAPGVYMLRLVNGNDIKTQKVIIK